MLETASIPGFLGNLDEMMEASDSEGAGWSAFIAAWWDRFGTADVLASDLFEIAQLCDPAPPMSGGNDRAQRTAFGMAISRMRDRIFRVGDRQLRLKKSGVEHKAARWQLTVCEARDGQFSGKPPETGEPIGAEGNLENEGSPRQPVENISKGEPGEPGEPFSAPLHTRMRARAHDRDEPGIGSPGSPGSQSHLKSDGYRGEPIGEPSNQGSQGSPRPDWLKELDP